MRLSSLELQMGLDALVTRLEVNVRDGLYVGFRGLGGIHVPDWKQLWVTDKLGKNSNDFLVQQQTQANLDRVKRKVRENKFISGFKTRLKRAYWWIYQLYCPVRLRDKLPKDFLRGHYTPQARWQLTAPGQMATLDDEIIKALQAKKRIDEQLTTLRSDIAETRSKGYATRVWNDLNELFGTYPGSYFEVFEAGAQEMATLRPLDHSILERRSAIADEITELNASSPLNLNYAPITDNDRSHVLRLEAPNTDFISKTRTPSIDELLGMKWMFLDIEVPYWKYDNPKVRWIGMKFWDGKKTISEIYTVNDVGTEEVRDYTIHRFDTTEEMIKAFTERTNELDPDIMSTYNTRYDLIKLRESCAGYPVDERGKDPVFDANTPFFERIGVRGRLVIDPMRWQKIAKSYDPNAKLEMALGKKKSITYDQMEVLETEDPLRVATYLTEDVDGLFSIFERDEFRKNLEDALFISG
ncbi:MAG: hypothetical protein KKG59_01780, partial [Nanoarchaeota archaeon]|nr:hypothetical protein [Nanoarchaeota archaeon]